MRYNAEVFGTIDTKKIVKDYGDDIGKFVIIRFLDTESNKILKVYGILTGITHLGHLIIKGNDKEVRHINPKNIENYHAKIDKFLSVSPGGEQNH
jgi:hypothetical protein